MKRRTTVDGKDFVDVQRQLLLRGGPLPQYFGSREAQETVPEPCRHDGVWQPMTVLGDVRFLPRPAAGGIAWFLR